MIRVQRPETEPTSLVVARDKHLPEARELDGAGGPVATMLLTDSDQHQPSKLVSTESISGYQVARDPLFTAQHGKCCYCESLPEQRWQDAEHFRPKSTYWWLAWSWDNLLFVCKHCNNSKSSHFPLRSADVLQPEEEPPGLELPVLVDPADETDADPVNHVVFVPDPSGGKGWPPLPRDGSARGEALIRLCGLDRHDLLTKYRLFATQMEDAVHRLRETSTDADTMRKVWEDVASRWLSESAPFSALARAILLHTFPEEVSAYGFDASIRPAWE